MHQTPVFVHTYLGELVLRDIGQNRRVGMTRKLQGARQLRQAVGPLPHPLHARPHVVVGEPQPRRQAGGVRLRRRSVSRREENHHHGDGIEGGGKESNTRDVRKRTKINARTREVWMRSRGCLGIAGLVC